MATEFAVILPHSEAHLSDAALDALEHLDDIESKLSIYREESEISAINRNAHRRGVRISSPTFDLLEASVEWSRRSMGAFDITAGPLIEAWGFNRRSGRKPSSAEIEQARAGVGCRHLSLNRDDRTVRLLDENTSLNLGAIGKGFALDEVVIRLKDAGIENALVHGGGSSIAAFGNQSPEKNQNDDDTASFVAEENPLSSSGWQVGIAHPTKANRRLGTIVLRNQSLSTSGSGKQFFHHRGRRYGHVIDPRTGYPCGDMLSLTVLCPDATQAEACSTALYVLGSDVVKKLHDHTEPTPTNESLTGAEADSQHTAAPEDKIPCAVDLQIPAWPTITVKQGDRQDAVLVERYGEFSWDENV